MQLRLSHSLWFSRVSTLIGSNQSIPSILVIVMLSFTLFNSNDFIYPNIVAYYGMGISTTLIAFTASLYAFKSKEKIRLLYPVIIFMLLTLYSFINGMYNGNINSSHYYLMICAILLVSISILSLLSSIDPMLLLWGFLTLVSFESSLCILQYSGFVKCPIPYFKACGTWYNPNVTAMFIALSFPAVLHLCLTKPFKKRRIIYVLLIFNFIALIILKCRSADIGALTGILIVLAYRYNWLVWINEKKNRPAVILSILLGLALCITLSNYFYTFKRQSADGRLLIWKLSLNVINEKPLLGHGYGMFEKYYNLFQSNYFSSSPQSVNEISTADHVLMAYNDLIENTIEGGLIGGFFLIIFFIAIIVNCLQNIGNSNKQRDNYVIYLATAISFLGCALFNFSLHAIPCMGVLIIVISLLIEPAYKSNIPTSLSIPSKSNWICAGLLLTSGLFIGYKIVYQTLGDLNNKKAKDLISLGQTTQALSLLKTIEPKLSNYSSFWENYADALFKEKKYEEAIIKYNRAKIFSSNPELFKKSGLCYESRGEYLKAISEHKIVSGMMPAKFGPKYKLLQLYQKNNKTIEATEIALSIIYLKAKVPSRTIYHIKREASVFLMKTGWQQPHYPRFSIVTN